MMNDAQANQDVHRHCREIERCNQRGGRMLSLVDLLDADTLTPELAAYCLAAIGSGSSFMIGALPGGAGKTTVMGALLNLVPADVTLLPADGDAAFKQATRSAPSPSQPRTASPQQRWCFICHEIGSGPYYAYLWDQELRDYFRIAELGHMLATNLHADTYEEAREQVCGTNSVAQEAFRRMNLMLFLSVRGGKRRIEKVWHSDSRREHRLVYAAATGLDTETSLVSTDALAAAGRAVDDLAASGDRTIQQVRAKLLESYLTK